VRIEDTEKIGASSSGVESYKNEALQDDKNVKNDKKLAIDIKLVNSFDHETFI
jgi:hypothetical protein